MHHQEFFYVYDLSEYQCSTVSFIRFEKAINSLWALILPVHNIVCLLRSTVWCEMRNRSILNVGGNNILCVSPSCSCNNQPVAIIINNGVVKLSQ